MYGFIIFIFFNFSWSSLRAENARKHEDEKQNKKNTRFSFTDTQMDTNFWPWTNKTPKQKNYGTRTNRQKYRETERQTGGQADKQTRGHSP